MTGKVDIIGTGTAATITLNADKSAISVGGSGGGFQRVGAVGNAGSVSVLDPENATLVALNASAAGGEVDLLRHTVLGPSLATPASPVITLRGPSGNVGVGGSGVEGNLAIYPAGVGGPTGHDDVTRANVHLAGADGFIRIGGAAGAGGHLALFPGNAAPADLHDLSKANVHLAGADGFIRIGGAAGAGGHLALFPGNAAPADLHDLGKASIHLDGQSGDIFLQNADCAEEFDLAQSDAVEPGTVMIIDREEKLRPSVLAYDKRVAGVVSGAGDYKPAIVLDKKASPNKRMPLALVGKAFCKVDAQYSPIEAGDLLTTSPTPGHAMRATDAVRAFGAVLGKALRPLSTGTGLVPILIALQ